MLLEKRNFCFGISVCGGWGRGQAPSGLWSGSPAGRAGLRRSGPAAGRGLWRLLPWFQQWWKQMVATVSMANGNGTAQDKGPLRGLAPDHF